MADKELKRMNHAELIEIIYQYEKKTQALTAENQRLAQELGDRRIRISEAGSIAEASLALNGIFESAQKAADEYIASIRAASQRVETETASILEQARQEADALREKGQREYEEKLARAELECSEMRRRITDLLLLDDSLGAMLGAEEGPGAHAPAEVESEPAEEAAAPAEEAPEPEPIEEEPDPAPAEEAPAPAEEAPEPEPMEEEAAPEPAEDPPAPPPAEPTQEPEGTVTLGFLRSAAPGEVGESYG